VGVQGEINWLRKKTELAARDIRIDYLQVPVLLRLNAGSRSTSGVAAYGIIGPAMELKIADEIEGVTVDDGFEGADMSLVFGGGIEAARIILEARYEKGLRRINNTFSDFSEIKKQAFTILFADSPGQTRDCRQPLAVAAQSDTACLCALVLAGAKIKDADRPDVCGMFCQSGTQARSVRIFCSPLLAAFSSIRPQYRRTINVAQFWTAHFLLVNGADVETRTCTSVMELVVRHWPITSQYRITKHLLSFGIDTTSREVELQFRFAMEEGAVTLAKLLLEHGVNAGDVARRGAPNQDPVVLAAREKHSGLVDLVLDREEVDHIHLFSLVHVYMSDTSSQGSDADIERAIRAFVEKGSSSWTQTKEPWAFAVLEISSEDGTEACKTVEESVTLLELAERIVNKNARDRQKILRLLNSKV
jgi:hypothetical protein